MTQRHDIKRIVILTQNYFPLIGGITTWCYEYARAFRDMGFEVIVVAPGPADLPPDPDEGFHIIRLSDRNWKTRKNYRIYGAIKHLINEGTVFLCANWKMAVPCMMHSLHRRIRYFTAVHGLDAFERRKVNRRIQHLAFARGDGIIPVSNYTLDLMKPFNIAPEKYRVVNNGVDLEKFPLLPRDPAIERKYGFGSEFRLISISRIDIRKGFDMTIRALPFVNKPIVYYIAGEGKYRLELERIIAELDLADRVQFIGFVPDEELAAVYTCGDLFSMPSRRHKNSVEGFGIVYLEAAACGVPSIAGKNSGGEDAVLDGETGFLVDPHSPEDIATAINRAIEDRDVLNRMRTNGRSRVEQFFTWGHLASQMLDFMRERLNA